MYRNRCNTSFLDINRNTVSDLMCYWEKADMINQLRSDTEGIRLLGKVDKVYLNNTNLAYALILRPWLNTTLSNLQMCRNHHLLDCLISFNMFNQQLAGSFSHFIGLMRHG